MMFRAKYSNRVSEYWCSVSAYDQQCAMRLAKRLARRGFLVVLLEQVHW